MATLRGEVAGISSIGAFVRRLGYRERVGIAVLAGLIIRVTLAISDDVITNDASAYLRSGASLWAGDGFRRDGHPELHFPPLYPAVIGGLHRLLGDPQRAMVAATLIASTALLLLIASLGRRLGGDRAAVAAVWVAALAPGLTDVPVTSGSGNEVWFVLLVLAAIRLALLAHDRTSWARHFAALGAGAMVGCTYLTRPEGLLYAPVAMMILLAPIVLRAARDRLSRVAAAGWIALGLAVFVIPYASYLHSNTGSWEVTAKTNDVSMTAWQAVADHDRETRDAEIYELADDGVSFVAGRSSLASLAQANPGGYGHIVTTNLQRLVEEVAKPVTRPHISLGWALLPLPVSLFAIWGAWRLRRRPSVWLLLTALLLPTATALAFFVQARYLIPATAFVCLLAGLAFAELRGVPARIAVIGGAVFLVLSLVASLDGSDGYFNRREPVEHRLVGEWLHDLTAPDARVMTRSMVTEYYAARQGVAIPYASPEEVLAFAAHHGVDYIVADSFSFAELRPQLVDWIDGPPPEGYEVVYEHTQSGRKIVVLKAEVQPLTETADPPGIGFMGDG
jgi:4-amino-4-deoxy-L-arabinose transferase-like glycosyltransferase